MGTGSESLPTFHSWVGGREVEGRAGRARRSNPATGEAFAQASLLDAAQAGGGGRRRRRRPSRPGAARASASGPVFLDRLRQAIVDEADEIARLIEREQGKPAAEALAAEILPSLDALQHLSAHAEDLLRDDAVEAAAAPARPQGGAARLRADRRRPRRQAVELPVGAVASRGGLGARGGEHRRPQARPGHDAGRAPAGRARAKGGLPGRGRERGRRRTTPSPRRSSRTRASARSCSRAAWPPAGR